jgi:hypothetical protein
MNISEPLSTDPMWGTYITTDADGTVFISNAEAAEGKYFAFSPDLQTKLWEKGVNYNYYAGPQISKDGIFVMAGNGTTLQAYKTSLPHRPVSWFEADLTLIPENMIVHFSDISSFDPSSWHWIFEGGIPAESSEQDPGPVMYNNPGNFSVTLITTNSFGTDTLVRECYIQVEAVPGISTNSVQNQVNIYPNPCNGNFSITMPDEIEKPVECSIFDIYGRNVHQFTLSQRANQIQASLKKGIYMIQIPFNNQALSFKLIVQ